MRLAVRRAVNADRREQRRPGGDARSAGALPRSGRFVVTGAHGSRGSWCGQGYEDRYPSVRKHPPRFSCTVAVTDLRFVRLLSVTPSMGSAIDVNISRER